MEKAELIITDALEKIEQTIYDSPIPRLRTDDRLRIVNSDEISDMISDIKTQLPAEIRRANSILMQMEAKIQSATDYADKICKDAEKNADETMLKANSNAQKAVNEANEYYDDKVATGDEYLAGKVQEGDNYYNDRIAEAKEEAASIIEAANAERDRLISAHEVTIAAQQEAEEYRAQMAHRANQIFNNANKRADEILATLMGYLEEYYNNVQEDRNALEIKANDTETRRVDQSMQKTERKEGDQNPDDDHAPSFFDIFKRKRKPQTDSDFDDNN